MKSASASPDDLEAQESQRPIAVHALENLAHDGYGHRHVAQAAARAAARIEKGADPINIVRDAAANQRIIETHAWNTILSREEAAQHRDEDV